MENLLLLIVGISMMVVGAYIVGYQKGRKSVFNSKEYKATRFYP